jgi:polyphenol oxidase
MNYETFPALAALPIFHAFTGRVAGLEVKTDRETALQRLEQHHRDLVLHLGLGARFFVKAQQVHGANVAVVRAGSPVPVADVDALLTNDPAVCLGIYVADCGPVWLVDPVNKAIGCVHSGRKGTDLGIVKAAIKTMCKEFDCRATNIIAQLGPCIRPPHYEINFAAQIVEQCREAGVGAVHDCGICTGANLDRYYSYRMEKGQTGRMLALLALEW